MEPDAKGEQPQANPERDSEMNRSDTRTTARSLPALPTVFASSMLYASAYKPTPEERAAMVARADFYEEMELPREVTLPVIAPMGNRIGDLRFTL